MRFLADSAQGHHLVSVGCKGNFTVGRSRFCRYKAGGQPLDLDIFVADMGDQFRHFHILSVVLDDSEEDEQDVVGNAVQPPY